MRPAKEEEEEESAAAAVGKANEMDVEGKEEEEEGGKFSLATSGERRKKETVSRFGLPTPRAPHPFRNEESRLLPRTRRWTRSPPRERSATRGKSPFSTGRRAARGRKGR